MPNQYSIHHLENEKGDKVAMICSGYLIEEFWHVKSKEKKQVQNLIKDLRLPVDIDSFPCYSQHHAIVFYMDRNLNSRLTPFKMAALLSDKVRGPLFKSVMSKYITLEDVESWAEKLHYFTFELIIQPKHNNNNNNNNNKKKTIYFSTFTFHRNNIRHFYF